MNNLSQIMQERLDKWRQNALPVKNVENVRGPIPTRRRGKNDTGDAMTLEEWNEEVKKSQTRK